MGIKERRQREIVRVKADILKAARQLARQNGWPAVSIRKIAGIIEYTPPVIYEHFKNKEAILSELELEGFQSLRRMLDDARTSAQTPEQQLLAISEAYWDFAFNNPDLYQVMFNMEGVQSQAADTNSIRNTGKSILESLRYLQTFPAERESAFFNWWAMAHGFVGLAMSGQLPEMDNSLKSYFMEATKRLVSKLS